jgi:hypothetical protein
MEPNINVEPNQQGCLGNDEQATMVLPKTHAHKKKGPTSYMFTPCTRYIFFKNLHHDNAIVQSKFCSILLTR